VFIQSLQCNDLFAICTLQFVYRIYGRGAKRDPTPYYWETAESL